MSVSFYLGNLKDGATTIDFVKNLDIDMSNGKARMVLNALGLPDTDDLCGHMDRVQFANLCASWLQQHIGKQSAEIEVSVTRGKIGGTVRPRTRPAPPRYDGKTEEDNGG